MSVNRNHSSGDFEKFLTKNAPNATTTYTDTATLALTDAGAIVNCNKATAFTVTVPPEADVAWPTNCAIEILNGGAGAITVAAGSGVTVNVDATFTRVLAGQYSVARLIKYGTNTWVITGDLVAA